MDKDLEDFNSFLKNVDQISDLVRDLSSSDVLAQQTAVQTADRYIAALELEEPCRTLVNRTVINTNSPQSPHKSLCGRQDYNVNPEPFMRALEEDAEDRARRRTGREGKAKALKEEGNEAYALGDYQCAVRLYSAALEEVRDMQPLYTNRAQAYIKLGKYEKAISDCQWALKCDEGCVKAYVHMGRAHLGLRDYSQARGCYQRIVDMDPGKDTLVKEYLLQVEREECREAEESQARGAAERGEPGAARLLELLGGLSRAGQPPLYYCGGVTLLSHAVTDRSAQTLFRLNDGFRLVLSYPAVSRCLSQRLSDAHSEELCVSVLRLWRAVCMDNTANQAALLDGPSSWRRLAGLLASGSAAVSGEVLALLRLFTETPSGRRLAADSLDTHMLLSALMALVSKQQEEPESTALTVLQNLALEDRFCVRLRGSFTSSVGPPFTDILRNITPSSRRVLPPLLSAIASLTRDHVLREELAGSAECWEALLIAMERCRSCEYREELRALLELLISLCSRPSPRVQEHAVPLSTCCLALLSDSHGGVVTRATGVLSLVLSQSPAATEQAVQQGLVHILRRILKSSGQTTTSYAIRTLAVCTASSSTAVQQLVSTDRKLSSLLRLLKPGCEAAVQGNAALCLGHCLAAQEAEGAAARMLGTGVVPALLRLAGGGGGARGGGGGARTGGGGARSGPQRNAAIALGRLCRAEPRHMDKLRELNGLEILHTCMKLIT